jgi:hypothetical protein
MSNAPLLTALGEFSGLVSGGHATLIQLVNATKLETEIRDARLRSDHYPSHHAYVLAAIARTLAEPEHRWANTLLFDTWRGLRLIPQDGVPLTVALTRRVEGVDVVFAPVIEAAHQKSVAELDAELRRFRELPAEELPYCKGYLGFVKRCPRFLKKWALKRFYTSPSWHRKYRRAAVAVNTVGRYGGDIPILPWPSWPLSFGYGSIEQRALVADGQVVAARSFYLTMIIDRRLAVGGHAAALVERIRRRLENAPDPERSQADDIPFATRQQSRKTSVAARAEFAGTRN